MWCERPRWRSRGSAEGRATAASTGGRRAQRRHWRRPPRRDRRGRESVPVPTIPGPMRAHHHVDPARPGDRERRGDRRRTARRRRSRAKPRSPTSTRPRARSARTASDSDTGSAPPAELDVDDPHAPPIPGAHGDELAVQPAADHRHPPSAAGSRAPSSAQRTARLQRGVRAASSRVPRRGAEPEAAREVRDDDVEAAGTELESRAWILTSTSSPSSTGPVCRGYATQRGPSTSSGRARRAAGVIEP